ncbi:nucleotide-binding universal stress UspA family protein [Actinocorallia herbida]|uniref:Nucleotide-binding universal stress UspA family protein n=1 Tax=Actinocorallia herbida TaxID=58109 RepID=A0A3N1D4U4_9ACTN|nr:universal stress protein [Actinocorallia herbida]ROO88489.1 nucleotide-binding universal stress UspA family protein [Actinocorallia herbida]
MSEIVVGYDGSESSERAIRWAARAAALRGTDLVVCHAWHWAYADPMHAASYETVRRFADLELGKGVLIAETTSPRVKVRKALLRGPAAATLLHEATDAAMLVVGARGAGGFPDLASGSVARQVAGYALCPVVVVREPAADGPVVVGVDLSRAGGAALALAFEESALRRRELIAVHAAEPPADGDLEEFRREAGARLQREISAWRTKHPTADVTVRLVHAPPREVLLEAAQGASLLIVGDRGDTAHPNMRLGAVSGAVLDLAPCNVAVTRPYRDE